MQEKMISTKRGVVYYWSNTNTTDATMAIVFCHGVTADHHLFDKQTEDLETSYRLINWDLPLHGKSKLYQDFSYHHACEDLLEIMLKEKIETILLIGQSAGGYIAQQFMVEHPKQVVGFIGIGTTPFGKQYYKSSDLFWIRHYTTIAKMYPYRTYCRMSADAASYTKESRSSFYEVLCNLGKEGMLRATKGIYDEFLKVGLDEVNFKCPVLLTYGAYDQVGYVVKYNKAWSKTTGYLLTVIPEAAHNANYDNYQVFNELIRKFILDNNL